MLKTLSAGLSSICRTLAALASALLAVLITMVVFERFVMHTTPHWAEELPRLVLVWLAFIGGVVCAHDRTHLVAGMLPYIARSPHARRWVERFNQLVMIVGLAVLAWAGWELAQITMGQTLTALDLPTGLVYLALPVGCTAAIIVHVAQLFEPADAPLPEAPLAKD